MLRVICIDLVEKRVYDAVTYTLFEKGGEKFLESLKKPTEQGYRGG